MNTGNYPERQLNRLSDGMTQGDWQRLAMAYDTWNDHLDVSEAIDEDIREFVRDVFSAYDLWNDFVDEPDLHGYRLLMYNRC